MHKFKTLYIIITISFTSVFVYAQNNTNSPYSKLGLGEFSSSGFGSNRAMGGTGIALKSTSSLNSANAASLNGIDSLTTLMEFGMQGTFSNYETSSNSGSFYNGNFAYLAMGFHVKKYWGMAFGIMPYTNVGYSITEVNQVEGANEYYKTYSKGSGGLSNIFLTNSFKIYKNTSVGLNASFIFGPKTNAQTFSFDDNYTYELTDETIDKYKGWKFDLGLQHDITLNNDNVLSFGLTTNIPGRLKNKTTRLVIQQFKNSTYVDTLENTNEAIQYVNYSMNFGAGIAYKYKNKLIVTGDIRWNRWSKLTVNDEFSELIDNKIFAFGLQYSPKSKHIYRGVILRAGYNYQTGYFLINGNTINSMAFTGGAEFMIHSVRLNLFGEYQIKGTTQNNLIKENITRIGLNIIIQDSWFHKRQYN